MMNKINKKLLFVSLFALLLTLFLTIQTYALFETDSDATTELDIGEWIIALNNNNITRTQTITLNNFVYNNGTHTQSGYLAPGTSAYFDLTLDATESDVSVLYELTIDDTPIIDYPNISLSFTNLSTNVTSTSNNYSGTILLNDANRVVTIRINLVWDNQAEYDNTDINLLDEELELTINANFEQYIS